MGKQTKSNKTKKANKPLYGTQKQQLNKLSKREYIALKQMCFLCKNIYNVGLYNVRQYFFNEKKYLRYNSNYHLSKENENYKMLNSNVAQQILMEVDGAMGSFFELRELAKAGKYNYKDIKLPKYLEKDGYFTIIIGQIRIKPDGTLDIPMSPQFKRKYGKVSIKVPRNLRDKKIKEIRIIPTYNTKESNMGKKNNQNFVNIPLGDIGYKLEYLSKRNNINFLKQEESYTSKSDFLANDPLPKINLDNPRKHTFSGKRISRGQYKSSTGIIINADVNGSLNILRKANIVDISHIQREPNILKQPTRIKIA